MNTGVLVCLASLALIGLALWALNRPRTSKAHEAALRVETAKAIQAQRAAHDAPCVSPQAARDVPKRKPRATP